MSERRPASGTLCFALCLIAGGASAGPGTVRVDAGLLVDVFSESYGEGDLFSDLDDRPPPAESGVPAQERIRTDDTEVSSHLRVAFERDVDRRISLDHEQSDRSAKTTLAGSWRVPVRAGWELSIEERFRLQLGLVSDAASRDVLQDFEIRAERTMASGARMDVFFGHEISRVSGDSLDALFDYSLSSLGARLRLAAGSFEPSVRLEVARHGSPESYAGDHLRARGTIGVVRRAFEALQVELSLSGTRREYDGNGVASPSSVEVDANGTIGHELGSGFTGSVSVTHLDVRYDDPDDVYFDHASSRGGPRVDWVLPNGLSFALSVEGEWLRPRGAGGGAYDQSRFAIDAGFLGPGGLWIDVEEAWGWRNALGGSTGGLLTDAGTFLFESSDFFYNEITALVGVRWRSLRWDVFWQHTRELHEMEVEDVSFHLLNLRTTLRY